MNRAAAVAILSLLLTVAHPAGADLATGTISDPDDVTTPLDLSAASLSDQNGTITLTASTHEAFTNEQTAFFWYIQGRSDDTPDAFVSAGFDEATGQFSGFLLANPGGTVTVRRTSATSIEAVFARNALGDMGALSFIAGSGDDFDGDGTTEEREVDQAPEEFAAAVFRIAGDDRIATALRTWTFEATSVVLARSDAFADALAGVPLAHEMRAPLLLTPPGALDRRVRDAIARDLPRGSTVFLLGGPGALSPTIEADLADMGYSVVRFGGADRYDTAVRIAREGLGSPDTVFFATGSDFADAVAGGPAAAVSRGAVLLTDGTRMPAVVRSYLDETQPSQRFALGGPAAAADPSATAIVGGDRYDTAVRVAARFFPDAESVAVVSGFAFPDALAAGPLAAREAPPAPLLLIDPNVVPAVVDDYLGARREQLQIAVVFGGIAVVPEPRLEEIEAAIL